MKSISPEELAASNGVDGKPALVAVNGKVYDLTSSKRWPRGNHMKRHQAGADLSSDILSAPHGLETLERFEAVAALTVEDKKPVGGLRGKVESFLDLYPWFRRHPHPAVVHFPVGFLVGAPVLETLGLVSNSTRTEWAAYCCLLVATLSIFPTMATGYFTWWINYECRDSQIISKKRHLAWGSLFVAMAGVLARSFLLEDPMDTRALAVLTYAASLWALAVIISYLGFLGGKLVFPYESH